MNKIKIVKKFSNREKKGRQWEKETAEKKIEKKIETGKKNSGEKNRDGGKKAKKKLQNEKK